MSYLCRTLPAMDIALVAIGCLVIGGALAVAFQGLHRKTTNTSRHNGNETESSRVPLPDIIRLLGSASAAGVITNQKFEVVATNDFAHAFDLFTTQPQSKLLTSNSMHNLAASAQESSTTQRIALEVPRRGTSAGTGAGMATVEVRAVPLRDGFTVILAEDRTAARQLDSVRRDFVANISHELKTPVGAISLLAETVEDAADDPQMVADFARRIKTESRRLGSLVHEVIELSRAEAAAALNHPRLVSVDALIADAAEQSTTTAAAREITLALAPETGLQVRGDHDVLVTAVRNLVDNAIAYSPEGSHVAIGAKQHNGLVEVAVIDHGPGIDPELQPRIFERFFRIDPARSRETGGSGLGLSIVKHVAAEHGGDVSVWSKPGHGSTFTLRLPHVAHPGPDAEESKVEEK